ncbi:hypothetical protein EXIGLDRAFT_838693 [Exidia glandulosa HHB12029]|uniref:Uncharacterized protein n=1 Tax=Exidia glandulosa HHB12029 TaxID=1314781 RepID=A0A165FKC9_EXIGL|nr:hypothetical protein EXIGLDRAFT_838693 [Exidia glandulosa HHB12029]
MVFVESHSLFTLLFALTTLAVQSSARQNNNTIDDTNGDPFTGVVPSYEPPSQWISRGAARPCPGCGVQPDPGQTLSQTWHEITNNLGQNPGTMTFTFTGIALYVFCILPGTVQFVTTESHLQFFIDDKPVGSFNFVPTTTAYQYQHLVFSVQSLANVQHTFRMSNTADAKFGPMGSIALFDYALYTRSTDPPGTTDPPQSPPLNNPGPTNPSSPTIADGAEAPPASSSSPTSRTTQQQTPLSAPSTTGRTSVPATGSVNNISLTNPTSKPGLGTSGGSENSPSASTSPTAQQAPMSTPSTGQLGMWIGIGVGISVLVVGAGLFLLLRLWRRRPSPVATIVRVEAETFTPSQVTRERRLSMVKDRTSTRGYNDSASAFFPTSSSTPTSSRAPASTVIASDSTQLQEEIILLRNEVDRLRVIADEVPPPTYDSRSRSSQYSTE